MAVFVLWLRRVVLHLYFGHRDIWWSMVTMYFSYEVWLQFTLVTKHGFSYLSFIANWWSMTTVYFDHRAIWWNITTVNLSYIAIWWSMATFVRLLHSYLMRYGYNVLFVTKYGYICIMITERSNDIWLLLITELFDAIWLHVLRRRAIGVASIPGLH